MIAYELPQAMPVQGRTSQSPTGFGARCVTPPVNFALFSITTMTGARIFALAGKPGSEVSLLEGNGFAAARSHLAEEARVLSSKWNRLLLDRNAEINANALTLTARPVFQALLKLGPGAIDLRKLPVEKVNGVHLAVILRATLTKKDRTPGWAEALEVARLALRRDGLSEDDALGGLD